MQIASKEILNFDKYAAIQEQQSTRILTAQFLQIKSLIQNANTNTNSKRYRERKLRTPERDCERKLRTADIAWKSPYKISCSQFPFAITLGVRILDQAL